MFRYQRVRRYMWVGVLAVLLKLSGAAVFFAGTGWSIRSWVTRDRAGQQRMASRLEQALLNGEEGVPQDEPRSRKPRHPLPAPHRGVSVPARANPPQAPATPARPRRDSLAAALLDSRMIGLTVIALASVAGLFLFVIGEVLAMSRNFAVNSDVTVNLLRHLASQRGDEHRGPGRIIPYPHRLSG